MYIYMCQATGSDASGRANLRSASISASRYWCGARSHVFLSMVAARSEHVMAQAKLASPLELVVHAVHEGHTVAGFSNLLHDAIQ